MKTNLRYQALVGRDVPEALDRRILNAAAVRARMVRRRRIFHRVFGVGLAAAAGLLIAGALHLFPGAAVSERNSAPSSELLALNDWSELEQENYNLSFELYCGRQAVSELADASWKGI